MQKNGTFLYKCICSDGSEPWLSISKSDYRTYFDQEADHSENENESKKIEFNVPFRLYGNVMYGNIFKDNYSDEQVNVKLFNFIEYIYNSETDSNIECYLSNYGTKFDENMRDDVLVYEDVIIIYPAYEITWLGMQQAYMCKCLTAEPKSLWMIVSVAEYNTYFSSSASLATATRIFGSTIYAADEISNLDEYSDIPSLVINFSHADTESYGTDVDD